MESKGELRKNDIKNHLCYHFDDIVRFWDRDTEFSDILLDTKQYEISKNIFNLGHFIQNFNSKNRKSYLKLVIKLDT